MEACRDTVCKRSSDLGLGVKSQSRSVIAGSCRSWPQSSLDRDYWSCRATDLEFRGRNSSVSCPTPNGYNIVEVGRRGSGVSLESERGTTQTIVKVPKYWLSVKG